MNAFTLTIVAIIMVVFVFPIVTLCCKGTSPGLRALAWVMLGIGITILSGVGFIAYSCSLFTLSPNA